MKENKFPNRLAIIKGCNIADLFFSTHSSQTASSSFSLKEFKQLRQTFHVTENNFADLELIPKKTKARIRPIKVKITNRLPPHVWRKTRSIFLSIQNLRSLHEPETMV